MKNALMLFMFCVAVTAHAQIRVTVNGRVEDGPADNRLYIALYLDMDANIYDGNVIDVTDGKFIHTFEAPDTLVYSLYFFEDYKRGLREEYNFIADNDIVTVDIFPNPGLDGGYECRVTGGRHNGDMELYKKEYDSLFRDIYYDLERRYDELSDDSLEEEEELDRLYEEIMAREAAWKYEYFRNNPSGYGVVELYRDLFFGSQLVAAEDMAKALALYEGKFSWHPYLMPARQIFDSRENLRPGSKYIDFMVEDIDGGIHSFSDNIEGKVTVLNLWASWCGPCRIHGMELIPVYERYKDRGFTVFGVAREYRNTDAFTAARERDGYPWNDYVELDNKYGIWNKYNLANSGGRMLLFDETGRLVNGNASVEEIAEFLAGRFD